MSLPNAAEIRNVSHYYGDQKVLSEVSCSFQKDAFTVILGKSGSGKSTLLKMLNGLVRPTQGEVCVFNTPLSYDKIESTRLKIGYQVQQGGLFPHLTIMDNLVLPGRIAKMKKPERRMRIKRLMDRVDLHIGLLDRYPYQLSGGEQQRAALCRAMLLNPPLLLLDEPFASLDNEVKESIYAYYKNIQSEEPRTIIMVTHDYYEAGLLGDYFLKIENGCIGDSGSIEKMEMTVPK